MINLILGIFVTFVVAVAQALCLSLLYDVFLQRKKNTAWYNNSFLFAFLVSLIYIFCLLIADILGINLPALVGSALYLLSALAVSLIFYKGAFIVRAVVTILLSVVGFGIEGVVTSLLSSIFKTDFILIRDNSLPGFILVHTACIVLLFLVCATINRVFAKEPIIKSALKKEWAIILYPSIVTMCTAVVIAQADTSMLPRGLLIVTSISILFLSFVVLYLFNLISKREKDVRDRAMLLQQNEQLIENAKTISEVFDGQRSMMHDTINQLTTAHQLIVDGDVEAASDFLQKKIGEVRPLVSHPYTGNPLVDAVLNQKKSQAADQGVKLEFHTEMFDSIPMKDEDLATILYNALDNAVDATSKVKGEKIVKLKLKKEAAIFIISIINPYVGKIKVVNNRIASTKEDTESHGYGLMNIGMVLSKYDHHLDIFTKDGVFQLTAIINY